MSARFWRNLLIVVVVINIFDTIVEVGEGRYGWAVVTFVAGLMAAYLVFTSSSAKR